MVHGPVKEHDRPREVAGVLQDAQDDVEDHDVRDDETEYRLDAAVDTRGDRGPELAVAAQVYDGGSYEALVCGRDHLVQEKLMVLTIILYQKVSLWKQFKVIGSWNTVLTKQR